jgi:hypothetical protein
MVRSSIIVLLQKIAPTARDAQMAQNMPQRKCSIENEAERLLFLFRETFHHDPVRRPEIVPELKAIPSKAITL